jgi:Ni,Fe-hydrogenase III small subunit
MSGWFLKGLRTGVVTTRYPAGEERAAGVSPGIPIDGNRALAERCPTGALSAADDGLAVDRGRCVHCFRCARGVERPAKWDAGFEWATATGGATPVTQPFRRSLHIRVMDAGGCGACLNEIKLLNNPYYNMHRLGFFITPTPRQADVLMVVGPVTDHLRAALQKTYDAMPTPKRVVAVGACALSGGVFGPSFMSGAGLDGVLPVDVSVPGCPPPPLALLHALLVVAGRRQQGGGTPR